MEEDEDEEVEEGGKSVNKRKHKTSVQRVKNMKRWGCDAKGSERNPQCKKKIMDSGLWGRGTSLVALEGVLKKKMQSLSSINKNTLNWLCDGQRDQAALCSDGIIFRVCKWISGRTQPPMDLLPLGHVV